MSKERIVVGVDAGTSKVCVAVGESHADGSVMILGIGQSVSGGIRKGEITDVDEAREAIHTAVVEAENSAGVEIHSVYTSITGGHIRSFNNHGELPVLGDDGVITAEDVEDVEKNAGAVSLPIDNQPIHTVRQSFYVDGQTGVSNPVGMLGTKLEVDVHVIHGVRTRLQNTVIAVKSVPLEVKGVVFSPLASALAVLTPQQKELGALLVDMGGGTTDYVVYCGGTIRHSGVIAVGGDHVTNDLSVGLKIPLGRAERLKIEHGMVCPETPLKGQVISLKRELALPELTISKEVACRIMELRLEETLCIIRADLEQQRLIDGLGAGVILTGGCAYTQGLAKLAEKTLGMPVRIGISESVSGVKSALESPECSTAIGLVKYAALSGAQSQRPRRKITERLLSMVRIW